MKQANLDRAVASATGESICFIRSMGFSLMPMPKVSYQSLGRAIGLQEALERSCAGRLRKRRDSVYSLAEGTRRLLSHPFLFCLDSDWFH